MSEAHNAFWDRRRSVRALAAGSIAAIVSGAILAQWSTGLSATYFADDQWQHPAYTIVDRGISTDTLTGSAPVSPDKPFSVRWFGSFDAHRAGTYAFMLEAEGGSAGMMLGHGEAGGRAFAVVTDAIDLEQGPHPISISYRHSRGRYGIKLRASIDGGPWTSIPSQDLAPRNRTLFAFRAIQALERLAEIVAASWGAIALIWLLRRVPARLAIGLVGVTVILVLAVVFDQPSWIRGPAPYPAEWQWDYHAPDSWYRIWPALIGAAAVIGAVIFLSAGGRPQDSRARGRAGLAAAMLGALILQFGVLHTGQGGAFATVGALTRSDIFTGYFGVAQDRLKTASLIDNYAQMLTSLPVHARTHPPGPVLYYSAFVNGFDAVPTFGMSLIRTLEAIHVPVERFTTNSRGQRDSVLAAAALLAGLCTVLAGILTAWPVARIAEAGGADPISAATAGALWGLCPAALFFLPGFDAIETLLVALASMLGCLALKDEPKSRAAGYAIGAGLIAGIALFCSFGAAPMLIAAGLTALVIASGRPLNWPRLALAAGAAVLGAAIVLSVPLALGFDFVKAFNGIMSLHRDHYTPPGRGLWLRFNLLDFSIFLGWPLIAWLVALNVTNRKDESGRLVLAMTVCVALIDILDLTRSEVGRLWMPLMPLIFAGTGITASTPAATRNAEWILVATLLAITSITIAFHWSP
jgi:hypothetical protein